MKSIARTAGLCLVAMITMGMALAGNAFATPLWLLCLEGSASTSKYSSNQCTKTEAAGKWESVALGSKTDTVSIVVRTLRLTDKEAGTVIECNSSLEKDEGEGTISSNNKGQIIKAKINNAEVGSRCKIIKEGFCKKLEEVHGVNLPWNTTIEEVGGELVTKIEASVAGKEPGWAVKCSGVVDECKSINKEYEEVTLSNVVTEGVLLVKGVFKKAHKAECSLNPGKRAGEVEGLVAILLVNKNGLSINKT
jgi:hypothetical protein